MSFITLQATKFRAQCCHECYVPTNYMISWKRSQNDSRHKKARIFAYFTHTHTHTHIYTHTYIRCCATNRLLVRSQLVSLEFFIDIKSFRSYYGPEVDSASNTNEYQEYFLGQGGRCVRLTTLPPSCAIVTKSGNPNFLESFEPRQACNGTAVPVCVYIYIYIKLTFPTTKVVNINLTGLLFTVGGLQCDMNCGRKIPILRRNLRLPSSG